MYCRVLLGWASLYRAPVTLSDGLRGSSINLELKSLTLILDLFQTHIDPIVELELAGRTVGKHHLDVGHNPLIFVILQAVVVATLGVIDAREFLLGGLVLPYTGEPGRGGGIRQNHIQF